MSEPELVALAERLQGACVSRGWTLATAESCTGGLIGHVATEVPGSSGYLVGGVIAYADEVKRVALGVPAEALDAHGAVSAQVALAMAVGVRRLLGTDIGVSVTGIAGPEGGTATKPVGLTYVAVAGPFGTEVRRHAWAGDRHANKSASARAAIELVLEMLGEPSSAPASGSGALAEAVVVGAPSGATTGSDAASPGDPRPADPRPGGRDAAGTR